jgi:hypothetical protein
VVCGLVRSPETNGACKQLLEQLGIHYAGRKSVGTKRRNIQCRGKSCKGQKYEVSNGVCLSETWG